MKAGTFFKAGALLAGIGVIAGAFGAHSLEDVVSAERIVTFETGVTYQMYHSFALLLVGWFGRKGLPKALRRAGYCFLVGILLFSGSLYALVLTNINWLGAITPVGGVAFIAGWILMATGVPGKKRVSA